MVIGTIFGMFIRVDGKPQICMLVSLAGCILNGALDFFLVDIMRFGIQGSAVASLIVQLLSVLVQMFYFISRKTGIGFRKFSFDREINKEMILNGSSEFIGEMASAISMFMFNYVLMKYVGAEGLWLQYDLYWIWAGNQSTCQQMLGCERERDGLCFKKNYE